MKLTELKPGDTVVIQQSSGFHARPYVFATVTAVGAKKIKTDRGDFSTANGHVWGNSRWSSDFIREDTTVEEAKERNTEIEADDHRRDLARKLDEYRWSNLPLEVLEQVDAIVSAPRRARTEE
jgi:hypothetical protein